MDNTEIARELGCSTHAVEHLVSKALRKIAAAGDMEAFVSVVRLTAIRKAKQVPIRCGSIECRPEKWVFFAGR